MVFDWPRLTDWTGQGISMFAVPAVCAMLGGVALLSLLKDRPVFRWTTRIAGSYLVLIAALTVVEHLLGWNLLIDTLLVNRPWGQHAASAPCRMGPPASCSFLTLGTALILATCGSKQRKLAGAGADVGNDCAPVVNGLLVWRRRIVWHCTLHGNCFANQHHDCGAGRGHDGCDSGTWTRGCNAPQR